MATLVLILISLGSLIAANMLLNEFIKLTGIVSVKEVRGITGMFMIMTMISFYFGFHLVMLISGPQISTVTAVFIYAVYYVLTTIAIQYGYNLLSKVRHSN